MIVPSKAALLALASICFDVVVCAGDAQSPIKSPREKAKYRAACPAYDNYAKFPQ